MTDFRVNTDVMRSGSGTVSSSGDKIGQVVSRVSSLNSQVPNSYEGQLRDKIGPILSGAVGDGNRLQGQSGQFSTDLNSFAAQVDGAMQAQDGMAVSTVLGVTASGSAVGSFFGRIGQAGMGALGFLLGLVGLNRATSTSTVITDPPPPPQPPVVDAPRQPPPPKPVPAAARPLGVLSAKYESGGDPGRVSSGAGDPGGVSYGAYQFTSAGGGTVAAFLKSKAGSPYAAEFDGLVPGSAEFSAKWKEIAAREPDKFLAAQHDYIQTKYYDVQVQKVAEIGLDVNSRSEALKNVIWSTSVQHGARTDIVEVALQGRDPVTMSDEEIIRAIYAERGRKNADGTLVHFHSSSAQVQKGVANRFQNELNDALEMLRHE